MAFLLAAPAGFAAPRHRAVSPVETPREWLGRHAIVLAGTEAAGEVDDLAPLAAIVGDAAVVGLGDGTHGTHEFFTTKLRILQFLVERMGFDVLAMEGSYPQLERINDYILGGEGDLRTLLVARGFETYYYFWDTEEFAAVIEWMRNYNLTRGGKPPVEIFGADVYDGVTAGEMVIDYLTPLDPAAASRADAAYACARATRSIECRTATEAIVADLQAHEADYTARTSARWFADALQAATVVTQSFVPVGPLRDQGMAQNVLFARDRRSRVRKVVYWAHAEHVTKGRSALEQTVAAGEWLRRALGSGYVAFGNATWSGTFLTRQLGSNELSALPFSPAGGDAYESFFHAGAAAMIVPLGGHLHPFLAAPHHLREAGSGGDNWDAPVDLRKKFDAVVWVDQTTATRWRH